MKNNRILKNTTMLYIMNIAKMIFPLLTLPYLARVLSVECYGTVAYVKAVMQYMQLIIDFGFLNSGTKDIVNALKEKNDIGKEVGNILLARLILAFIASTVLLVFTSMIPILKENYVYVFLSFIPIVLSCFLFDYLFRGLEKMQIITERFVLMKSISTVLTFVFVKSDYDVLYIPILDILGTVAAVILVFIEINKLHIRIKISAFRDIYLKIKISAVYFLSDIATTAFSALNTLFIGIYISTKDVAYWTLCLQMITAVQSLYTPITNGIYPEMIKTKNKKIVFNILYIFMPLIVFGCIILFVFAENILLLLGGGEYIGASMIFKWQIPILLFSFPAMLFGWPMLGAIEKAKETTKTTVATALIQILGLILLIMTNSFNVINIAILRCVSEFLLMLFRILYCYKFRKEFIETKNR